MIIEPRAKSLPGEGGDGAVWGNSGGEFCDVTQDWRLCGEVDHACDGRRQARPEVDVAEGVGAARAQAAFIVVR